MHLYLVVDSGGYVYRRVFQVEIVLLHELRLGSLEKMHQE